MGTRSSFQAVLLSLLLGAFPAIAQTGVFIGTVLDAAMYRPVAGVQVTALGATSVHTATTDADGNFRIPQLPPGAYSLVYSAEGFIPYQRTDITLRIDRTVRLNAQLLAIGTDAAEPRPPPPAYTQGADPGRAARRTGAGLRPLFRPRELEPARSGADCRILLGADEVRREAPLSFDPRTGQVVPEGTPGSCIASARHEPGLGASRFGALPGPARRALCRSALLWQLAQAAPGAFRVTVTR